MRIFLVIAIYALASIGAVGYACSTGDTKTEIWAVVAALLNIYLARRALRIPRQKSS